MLLDYTMTSFENNLSKEYIGGKAAGLFEMQSAGLNVPRWLNIPCHVSLDPPDIGPTTLAGRMIGSHFRKVFGSDDIVSIRSGAPISMPGMMDTLLNIGIDDSNFDDLLERWGSVAYDFYARLVRQYTTFEGHSDEPFAKIDRHLNVFYGVYDDPTELYKQRLEAFMHIRAEPLPSRFEQVLQGIRWVWDSYHSDRAIAYREMHDIPNDIGTGVIIQKMVFGNFDENSGTGVAFSHNPNTGERGLMGDFLAGGQGEEVVSGLANTDSISDIAKDPKWYLPIKRLRKHMLHMLKSFDHAILDVEFTIENEILYFLQVREAKCSDKAKVRVLVERAQEGLEKPESVTNKLIELLPAMAEKLASQIASTDLEFGTFTVGSALGACDGHVVGRIATTHEQARVFKDDGTPFIFATEFTSPNDLVPMSQSEGILTRKGGMLSHAALIAREWGKVAVVAFKEMVIESPTSISIDGESYETITLKVSNQKGQVLVNVS